jgi:hypothetical protein
MLRSGAASCITAIGPLERRNLSRECPLWMAGKTTTSGPCMDGPPLARGFLVVDLSAG